MLGNLQCPADRRIQAFLDSTLNDVCPAGRRRSGKHVLLDRPGLARVDVAAIERRRVRFTLFAIVSPAARNPAQSQERPPHDAGHFSRPLRAALPVPADKLAVPKRTFAALLARRCNLPRL